MKRISVASLPERHPSCAAGPVQHLSAGDAHRSPLAGIQHSQVPFSRPCLSLLPCPCHTLQIIHSRVYAQVGACRVQFCCCTGAVCCVLCAVLLRPLPQSCRVCQLAASLNALELLSVPPAHRELPDPDYLSRFGPQALTLAGLGMAGLISWMEEGKAGPEPAPKATGVN